eukprot:3364017-Rhodomonas_salina.1
MRCSASGAPFRLIPSESDSTAISSSTPTRNNLALCGAYCFASGVLGAAVFSAGELRVRDPGHSTPQNV